jgi:small redox-active disulfide protein 2
MEILILGSGCANCHNLEKATKKAITELKISATVSREEDIRKILSYGIIRTPGLVIDKKVVLAGRVPGMEELKDLLTVASRSEE